ncbi:MAG: hypothetical protein JO222_10900 [Frankiales bacterium]|nr:hypothetical protein [Frankiales bacterium]
MSPAGSRPGRALLASAGATAVATMVLHRRPPGGRAAWQRSNYRGTTVDLLGGPATGVGMLAGIASCPGSSADGALIAVGSALALGLYDDLAPGAQARGLGGHFAALRRGELTSGVVKMAGLAVAGLWAAGLGPRSATAVEIGTSALLVAGTANLVNLFDVRPGRSAKVVIAAGAPLCAGRGAPAHVAAAAVGAALTGLPADLAERTMLGDSGANALGAALGWAASQQLGGRGRLLALTAVVGLTLLSEKVSFSQVIASQPALAAVDGWGRQRT